MTEQTRCVVLAALNGDSSVTPELARAAIAVLEGSSVPGAASAPQDRVISRKEAAQLLGRTTRTVDALGKSGVLRRVKMGSRKRSFGILASSLVAAMRGGNPGKAVRA